MSEETVVDVVSGGTTAPFVFVCEHASHYIPEKYNDLGVSDEARFSHIAWDPGARDITLNLAKAFNAPAVVGCVSRIVYDCNRPPEAPDSIPSRSEAFDIPGNRDLGLDQIADRVVKYYRPFERALIGVLDTHAIKPVLVTIHSFAPVYNGKSRSVQLGVLHDQDARMADSILAQAGSHTEMQVERNQPYGPEDGVTHTLKLHGLSRGLLNVMLEIRNDFIQSASQTDAVSEMLTSLLSDAVGKVHSTLVDERAPG